MDDAPYTPLYRGTREEIDADAERANEWMRGKIDAAISDFPDEERAAIARGFSEGHCGLYSRSSSSPSRGHYSYRANRADFYHKWGIGNSLSSSYGTARIVMKKGGKINEDTLSMALLGWARQVVSKARASGIEEKNRAALAALNINEGGKISATEISNREGFVALAYRGDGIDVKYRDVPIADIPARVEHMRRIESLYLEGSTP